MADAVQYNGGGRGASFFSGRGGGRGTGAYAGQSGGRFAGRGGGRDYGGPARGRDGGPARGRGGGRGVGHGNARPQFNVGLREQYFATVAPRTHPCTDEQLIQLGDQPNGDQVRVMEPRVEQERFSEIAETATSHELHFTNDELAGARELQRQRKHVGMFFLNHETHVSVMASLQRELRLPDGGDDEQPLAYSVSLDFGMLTFLLPNTMRREPEVTVANVRNYMVHRGKTVSNFKAAISSPRTLDDARDVFDATRQRLRSTLESGFDTVDESEADSMSTAIHVYYAEQRGAEDRKFVVNYDHDTGAYSVKLVRTSKRKSMRDFAMLGAACDLRLAVKSVFEVEEEGPAADAIQTALTELEQNDLFEVETLRMRRAGLTPTLTCNCLRNIVSRVSFSVTNDGAPTLEVNMALVRQRNYDRQRELPISYDIQLHIKSCDTSKMSADADGTHAWNADVAFTETRRLMQLGFRLLPQI